MNLYLLRHADADTEAETDDERPLSEKGIKQAKRVGRFCKEREIEISAILTSPIRRARETAELFAKSLHLEITEVPWLASGARPEAIVRALREFRDRPAVVIVGHEPDFSALAAHLLGLPQQENIRVRKASLILLELDAIRPGAARLQFSLPCKWM